MLLENCEKFDANVHNELLVAIRIKRSKEGENAVGQLGVLWVDVFLQKPWRVVGRPELELVVEVSHVVGVGV